MGQVSTSHKIGLKEISGSASTETGQPVVGCGDFHYITGGCGGQGGEAENRQGYTLGLFDLVLCEEGYKFIVFPLYIYLKPVDEVKYNEVTLLNTVSVTSSLQS